MSFKKLLLLLILSVSSLAMVAQIKVTGVVLDENNQSFRKATEEMVQLLTSMVNSHLQCPPKPHL